MLIKRYARVSLRRELPSHHLERGDVATVVDFAPVPETGDEGCVLEVYNAVGELIGTVTVSEVDVQPLQDNEILCVRKLTKPIE